MPNEHEPRLRLRLALAGGIPSPRSRQSRMYIPPPPPNFFSFPSLPSPPDKPLTNNRPQPAALKNPTNPDSAVEFSSTSLADNSLAPSALLGGTLTPSDGFGGESNYEVFDPLNWMLDGLVDLPYDLSLAPDIEVQGLAPIT